MNVSATACEPAMAEETASSSNRYVAYVKLPILQEMAFYRVALAIWYSYISSHWSRDIENADGKDGQAKALDVLYAYLEQGRKMVKSLKMPTSIEERLSKVYMKMVYLNLKQCVLDFYAYGFDISPHKGHFDVNWCVWLPNGKIDYAKTASKIASAAELSWVQKFPIICKFCMEEEIKKFPLHLIPDSFISKLDFDRDYLMYYWIRYLRNELHEIPLNDFGSLDELMAVKCEDLYAFKYFWNRLGDVDQVNIIMRKFDNDQIAMEYGQVFISMMNWQQQYRMLCEMPAEIVKKLWVELNLPEIAIWAWAHTKSIITPAQFTQIAGKLLKVSVSSESNIEQFLELWHSASDQQRCHAIQELGDEPITALFRKEDITKAAFDFVFMYLSSKSVDFRRQVILRYAVQVGVHIENVNSINEIIQLCLPEPADQLEFKKLVMESEEMEERAVRLIAVGGDEKLKTLVLKIKYFCAANTSQAFVIRILKRDSRQNFRYVTNVKEWNKLSQFLDEFFPEDVRSALKKEFITSCARVCDHDWYEETDEHMDEIDQILKMVFANDDELQIVKKYFLDSFEKFLFDFNYLRFSFNETDFNRFLLWCSNGDKKAVAEYIKNVPLDAIFRSFLHDLFDFVEEKAVEGTTYDFVSEDLSCLDMFLRYFKGIKGARQYKLEMANSFERSKESFLNTVLNWIFDDDEESARKFKMERVVFL